MTADIGKINVLSSFDAKRSIYIYAIFWRTITNEIHLIYQVIYQCLFKKYDINKYQGKLLEKKHFKKKHRILSAKESIVVKMQRATVLRALRKEWYLNVIAGAPVYQMMTKKYLIIMQMTMTRAIVE